MENGQPPLLSRRIWPVTEIILRNVHPELTPISRKGVIDRIQFFRERIWDKWLHSALKKLVHGSGFIDGWGFCDVEGEDEDEEVEDGYYILGKGHARGLAMTSVVCDEGGWFQKREALPVPKVTDVAEIHEMPRRAKKEVANHAKALTHAVERMIVGEPTRDGADLEWTEKERKGEYRTDDEVGDDSELNTHAYEAEDDASVISLSSSASSLFTGQTFSDDDEWDREIQDKKKKYLSDWTKRNGKMCLRASAVEEYMGRMIEELNREIERIKMAHSPTPSAIHTDSSSEQPQKSTNHPQQHQHQHQKQQKPLDPYSLAAKHAHQFLMISPFIAGNGIISRLIMNILLLKYAGKMAPFGANSLEKEEYRDIMRRAARKFHAENLNGVEFAEHTSHFEMAEFLRMNSEGLEFDLDSDWTEL